MNNKNIIIDKSLSDKKMMKLSDDDTETISAYINIIDQIHTIENIIHIHSLNFHQIFYHFNIDRSGIVEKRNGLDCDNFSLLNSLTISFMATGKTLVEKLEQFDKKSSKSLTPFINNIYDTNFSYKLIITLRNFALHGHIPVYDNEGKFSFNLQYILDEGKNFHFSSSSEKALKEIIQKIEDQYEDIANIAYTSTIVKFQHEILNILIKFFTINKKFCCELFTTSETIIQKKNKNPKRQVVYFKIFNETHAITIKPMELYYDNIISALQTQKKEFEDRFKDIL